MQNSSPRPGTPRPETTTKASSLTRSARVVASATLLAMVSSCGPDEATTRGPSGLGHLRGQLVSDQAILLVPDKDWRDLPQGRWGLKGTANLLCWVGEPGARDLLVRVFPGPETTGCHFQIVWDEKPLPAFETPKRLDPGGVVLRVPAAKLTTGTHNLRLRRAIHLDARRDQERALVAFDSLSWGMAAPGDTSADGTENQFLPRDKKRHAYLASFLSLGLAGITPQRAEGCLFLGPGSWTTTFATDTDAEAHFAVENFSTNFTAFHVEIDGKRSSVDVAKGQRLSMEVRVAPGNHTLKLTVEGAEDGMFLWGAPYLHEPQRELPGPIIILSLDTTRRDALSVYSGHNDTPHLREFAQHATVYDNAWTTGPWTLPTHASMFTGLYPARHGAGVRNDHLRQDHDTLAEILQEHGYYTAGFVGGMVCSSKRGFGQGFHQFRDPQGGETQGHRLTGFAEKFLAEHHDKPLFLFMNYFDPHALFRAPKKWEEKFGVPALRAKILDQEHWNTMSLPGSIPVRTRAWGKIKMGLSDVTDDGLAYLRAAYRAEVAFMDNQLGRLFGILKRHGIYDRALIIIASDHGELLGENGIFSHSARLDPELVWMPLLVKWPGQTEARRVEHLASQVDFYPTILKFALDIDRNREGRLLQPEAESALAERKLVFIQEHHRWFHKHLKHMWIAPDLYCMQRQDTREVLWKADMQYAELEGQSWATRTSPQEQAQRWELILQWAKLDEDAIDSPTGLSREEEEALEQLGYTGGDRGGGKNEGKSKRTDKKAKAKQ